MKTYAASKGQEILVAEDSPIQTLADLKGKKLAFDKGSSAYYVLVRSQAKVGLDFSGIKPVYLAQSKALPRFRPGEIDAWVIWVLYTATLVHCRFREHI
ncbi:ABC transporter substrate-binding protein [Nostoc sp. DSM 114167]|uniref:ABC transporter substrate-binding protein n=1 Tax=Nostoc sp. DSM 114167 TaxID=3439050 RepID=UPI0040466891